MTGISVRAFSNGMIRFAGSHSCGAEPDTWHRCEIQPTAGPNCRLAPHRRRKKPDASNPTMRPTCTPPPCFICPSFGSHSQHSQHTCAHWNLTQVTMPMSRPVFSCSGSMREDVRLLATAHAGTCSIPMMLSGTCSLPSSLRCSRAGHTCDATSLTAKTCMF